MAVAVSLWADSACLSFGRVSSVVVMLCAAYHLFNLPGQVFV
jgi:hypothetical protein